MTDKKFPNCGADSHNTTSIMGGHIPIAGFIAPKQAEKAVLGTAPRLTLHPRGSGGKRYTVALVLHSDAQAQIAGLEAEVVRLRSALEFYGNPSNYIDTPPWDGDPDCITPHAIPVLDHGDDGRPCDCGDTARNALKGGA
jgi:hypothetical protein